MRTLPDRLRHTIIFEVLAVTLVAVGGSLIVGRPVEVMGALGLMFSALAMVWNLVFNWLFDLWDRKYRASAARGIGIRVVHAALFELGLLSAGIFLVAWWLDMGLLPALALNAGMSAFFLVYTFCFNWAYDVVFPVPKAA